MTQQHATDMETGSTHDWRSVMTSRIPGVTENISWDDLEPHDRHDNASSVGVWRDHRFLNIRLAGEDEWTGIHIHDGVHKRIPGAIHVKGKVCVKEVREYAYHLQTMTLIRELKAAGIYGKMK
jgi:hypothetical protein